MSLFVYTTSSTMKSVAVIILLVAVANAIPSNFPRGTLHGRIVGGTAVDIRQFPHQVSLQISGQHFCGGSIIDANHILTAAHCTNDLGSVRGLTVRAGSSYHFTGGQVVSVSEIWQHPNYEPRTTNNDIAVLTLNGNLALNSDVQSIRLTSVEPSRGQTSIVSGWGYTMENGQVPDQLRAVALPVVDRTTCNAYYGGRITRQMICAGYEAGGQDACQGDSGGPMIINGVQYGIVSWGIGCARPRQPGVFTNVAAYQTYLKALLN